MARLTNIGISSAEVARALKEDDVWAEAVLREWRSDCAPVAPHHARNGRS